VDALSIENALLWNVTPCYRFIRISISEEPASSFFMVGGAIECWFLWCYVSNNCSNIFVQTCFLCILSLIWFLRVFFYFFLCQNRKRKSISSLLICFLSFSSHHISYMWLSLHLKTLLDLTRSIAYLLCRWRDAYLHHRLHILTREGNVSSYFKAPGNQARSRFTYSSHDSFPISVTKCTSPLEQWY
jgi:hypothetical protein